MKTRRRNLWWVFVSLTFALSIRAQSEWTDKSPHKSAFITVNGVKLHYLDWRGKGDTMLLLHGLGDTPHIYDVLAPKFTNQFRVLGLTRRGHGESEMPDDGYGTATRVEDIRQFLDALKIPRAILVGHSAAGNELSLLAITHPERVIKLVYLDAAFHIDGQLELFERMLQELPEFFPTPADNESFDTMRRWYKRMNQGWSDALEATLRVNSTISNPEKRNRALSLMFQNEARPDHTKIKAPALMITVINPGAHAVEQLKNLSEERRKAVDDFLTEARRVKEKETELFRKAIPNGRLMTLTNADHHCFIDREDEVLREMREFLSDTGTRRHLTLPTQVALEIPLAPTPVKMNGRQCLVYELHITNFFTNRLELMRVEVLGDGTTALPLASYAGEELTRQMAHVGYLDRAIPADLLGVTVPPDQPDERVIGPGLRAVIFLLIATKGTGDVPKSLRHRLYFKPTALSGGEKDNVIEGAQVTVNRRAPVVLGAPLRGEGWLAAGGLSNMSYHRRVILAVGGSARIPQRFATDWAKLGADGSSFHGERANTNFYGYGAEVLAVADAVVAEVKDGIPENLTADDRAVPITLETAGGNSVVLDLGKGNFAWYAHLKPQSVRVRAGERVRRGQVLARLGNSGNSFSPHLHFHMANGRSPLASEGGLILT